MVASIQARALEPSIEREKETIRAFCRRSGNLFADRKEKIFPLNSTRGIELISQEENERFLLVTVIITSLRWVSRAKALRGSYFSSVKNVSGDCDRGILYLTDLIFASISGRLSFIGASIKQNNLKNLFSLNNTLHTGTMQDINKYYG